MNTITAIQVLPVTTSQEDLLRTVNSVIDYIASTGYNYQVGPLETTVEGDYEELLDTVREAQLICIRQGAGSMRSYVKIFYNPKDHLLTIDKETKKHR